MAQRKIKTGEWLEGCALATVVSGVVGLPALGVIIVVLWLWELVSDDGRSSPKDDGEASGEWCE